MSWILAFLGFAVLIILHELGHFTAAKAVGMRVERFSLFFPPLVARRKRGETEYAIGSIPLGGYVKITGMNPEEEIPPDVAHRAYFRQPVWKRIVVIGAGPAVNIVLALVLLTALPADLGDAGEHADQPGRGARARPAPRRRCCTWATASSRSTASAATADALRDAGRDAHLRRGQGRRLQGDDARRGDDRPRRQGADGHHHAAPTTRTPGAMLLGFSYGVDRTFEPVGSVGEAVSTSVTQAWTFTRVTVETIAGIFQADKRKEISGVVGSYETTRQAIELSADRAVFLLAVISLSLGIINLFPFLPLDGGHIFWALAEKVRGKAIPFSVMERAGFVGFALVIGLFVIGLTNDIGRLTGEGFGLR